MHEAVGKLTIGGEQQQAGGVDVQTPYLYPAHALQSRQVIKHRGAPFWIIAGAHFAGGLWYMITR